jgi:hypothetical protein
VGARVVTPLTVPEIPLKPNQGHAGEQMNVSCAAEFEPPLPSAGVIVTITLPVESGIDAELGLKRDINDTDTSPFSAH